MREGRYEGDNIRYFLELRLQTAGQATVSGDLFRAGPAPRDHLASFRSTGPRDTTWPVECRADDGSTSRGALAVTPLAADDETVTVRLTLDRALPGLPFGEPVALLVRWVSAAFRRLNIETETEVDVEVPGFAVVNGARVTFADCMRRAGVEVAATGQPSTINRKAGGWAWHDANIQTALEALAFSRRQLNPWADWQMQMLMLSKSTRNRLYGVMYDIEGGRPRQGCAVFVDEIREEFPGVADREIIWTMAHEVGHALNLAHRFDPAVGRPDSTSVMNYADKYRGGNRMDEYWRRFTYSFDPDELAFMCHGPRPEVMPGGSPFHSADYWSAAAGGRPVLPSAQAGFTLTLVPPPGGAYFEFGQPVLLEVALTNVDGPRLTVSEQALDIKAGDLEVLVQPMRRAGTSPAGPARSFIPAIQRCVSATGERAVLHPGATKTQNVSLSFGAGGFTLADPGGYRLTPVLTVPGADCDTPPVVLLGEPLEVWVAYPQSRRDERQALRLLQPDVGGWLSLGGGSFGDAADVVREVRDERAARETGLSDPLAATLTRTLAIHFSRSRLAYDRGGFSTVAADRDYAAGLLTDLVGNDRAMNSFDPSTERETRELAVDVCG